MKGERGKKLLCGIIPVILFGLFAGYLLWYKVFEYPPHLYPLDFDGALWLSTGKATPHGYFAKEIYIPDEAVDAWISVAATDEVTLFVNGTTVATDTFVSLNVSAIHDVTGKVHYGKNVVAAYVHRSSYPGEPRLLLKGTFVGMAGKEHPFSSDGTWRVSPVEETQGQGDISWHSEQFDRSSWAMAEVRGSPSALPIRPSLTSPTLLAGPLAGRWMWHPRQEVRSAYFSKSLTLDSPLKDAFIGVAGSSFYDLTVNGVSVGKGNIDKKQFDIYNIASLLQRGENEIGIGVEVHDTIPGLLVDGCLLREDGSYASIRSDETWKTLAHPSPGKTTRDRQDLQYERPLMLAKYPAQPWGLLAKNTKEVEVPPYHALARWGKFIIFLSLVTLVAGCAWFIFAFLFSLLRKGDIWEGLFSDGLLHISSLLFLLTVYLMKFDVRYDPSFPFQYRFVLLALAVVLALRIAAFLGFTVRKVNLRFFGDRPLAARILSSFLLLCLIAAGFLIRFHNLDGASLSHDEVSMMQYTEALLTKGSASKLIGPYVKPMTTYEFLPPSIAVPVTLFGFNEFGARMHSVFWGTLEILLIYLLGKALLNRKTGFAAAALYAFHPWCIGWSRDLFYPQMTQTLATLTIFFFYKAIRSTALDKKYLYLTSISFSIMYLSWEGSGFLLFGMFMALLAHQGKDLSWLRNKHLWGSLAVVALTVFVQQSRRMLAQNAYLIINTRIMDVSLPSLFFLDPMYNPYFYIDSFFFMENNWALSCVLIAGIPLLFRHRPLRFLYALLLGVVFFMTNFLSVAASRYIYHSEPVLILIASAVVFLSFDVLKDLLGKERGVMRSFLSLSALGASLVLFLSSNSFVLNLYLLSKNPFNQAPFIRRNIYWNDYRSTNLYVKERIKKGDVVFTMMPHTLNYYAGIRGDYSFSPLLASGLVYDVTGEYYPGLIDKYMGNPTITSIDEFKRIMASHDRIWFISAPHSAFNTDNNRQAVDYITRNFKVVFESYNTRVYLREKSS